MLKRSACTHCCVALHASDARFIDVEVRLGDKVVRFAAVDTHLSLDHIRDSLPIIPKSAYSMYIDLT